MTAVLGDPDDDWDVKAGIHPDLRAARVRQQRPDGVHRRRRRRLPRRRLLDPGPVSVVRRTHLGLRRRREDDDPLQPRRPGALPDAPERGPERDRPDQRRPADAPVPVALAEPDGSPRAQIFGGTQDNGTWSFDTSRSSSEPLVRVGRRRRRPVGLRPDRRRRSATTTTTTRRPR